MKLKRKLYTNIAEVIPLQNWNFKLSTLSSFQIVGQFKLCINHLKFDESVWLILCNVLSTLPQCCSFCAFRIIGVSFVNGWRDIYHDSLQIICIIFQLFLKMILKPASFRFRAFLQYYVSYWCVHGHGEGQGREVVGDLTCHRRGALKACWYIHKYISTGF